MKHRICSVLAAGSGLLLCAVLAASCGQADMPESEVPAATSGVTYAAAFSAAPAPTCTGTSQPRSSGTRPASADTPTVTDSRSSRITTLSSSAAGTTRTDSVGKTQIIRVDDRGLKGDGTTDNFLPLARLLNSTMSWEGNLVFEFSKDKTYHFDSSNQHKVAITLANRENITLRGDNTTITLDNGYGYLDIQYCRNIRIEGFNFKYSHPVYTMAEVLRIDTMTRSMEVQTAEPLGISGTWTRTDAAPNFGFPDLLDQGRFHMFFDRVDTLDAGANRYRIWFEDTDDYAGKIQRMIDTGCDFIMPVPDIAHHNGSAVVVTYTDNLTMEDINLWSASCFSFHMRYNTGRFILRRTNIVPEPGSVGKIVSWRDGFHIKENRAQFLWEDCQLEGCGDDIFNLSCSMLTVDEVFSPTEFSMGCREFGGVYPMALQKGDKLTLYNVETGALVGETVIERVVRQEGKENRIITQDAIPYNAPGVQVAVNSLANPGAEIRRCSVDGSFRFRGEVTCTDSNFRITYSWIENEHPFEGPIPQNILFRNCTLKGLSPTVTFMSLGATANVSRPQYQCKNIRFIDCDVNPARIYMRPGNDVKFIQNGQVYYTCPK